MSSLAARGSWLLPSQLMNPRRRSTGIESTSSSTDSTPSSLCPTNSSKRICICSIAASGSFRYSMMPSSAISEPSSFSTGASVSFARSPTVGSATRSSSSSRSKLVANSERINTAAECAAASFVCNRCSTLSRAPSAHSSSSRSK